MLVMGPMPNLLHMQVQGLAGGLMLSLSFVDLLPQSMQVSSLRKPEPDPACCLQSSSAVLVHDYTLQRHIMPAAAHRRLSAFC